ncbi:MAG: helix-turn-helix domain-containing protein [Marinilabiliaceae bacterium]|nr:helix-turn-helix domain-containing protein [Marinilabiliaceae bacterium]
MLIIGGKTLLDVKETSEYIGVSKRTLYNMTSKKKIPHLKPRGGKVFFEKEEIDKWMLRNHQPEQA